VRLGLFDSGLGGLIIAQAVRKRLPDIDMMYLGDTLHAPYGGRSGAAIFDYTKRAMDFLFGAGCMLIVVACNTATACALRRLQQEYLPARYPGRRILGVIVPTLEAARDGGHRHFGLLATASIVQSGIYQTELVKIDPAIEITAVEAPLLVPMIEHGGMRWIDPVVENYVERLIQAGVDCILLGCTHYPILKDRIARVVGSQMHILSQDAIIPEKLADYLDRHPDIAGPIARNGEDQFFVTDITPSFTQSVHALMGRAVPLQKAVI